MWGEFAWATALVLVLLYLPGYLFLRALRVSRALSLSAAPLYGVAAYSSLPIAYYELGIPCSPLTILVPTCLVALLAYGWRRWRGTSAPVLAFKRAEPIELCGRSCPFNVVAALAFVLVATIVCLSVFVCRLPGANAFAPRFDNNTHLNLCRAFLDSGRWSSLHTSTFLASTEQGRSIAGNGGFYPSGWNCVVVLVAQVSRVDLMVALNAVVGTSCAVVFPVGMFAFMRALLPNERRTILLGALVSVGFANWPWQYIHTGPLHPNLFGIALQMGALALALTAASLTSVRRHIPPLVILMLVSLAALALAHPSTVFSCYLYLAFYGAHRIWRAPRLPMHRGLALATYWVAIIVPWVLFYAVPALQPTIGYVEREQTELLQILPDFFGMSFCFTHMQIGMAALTWVGVVCVARTPRRRWLLLSLCFFSLGYLAARADWWLVKHWVAALWYSDLRRMAANFTIFAMPVAAIGLNTLLPPARALRDDAPTTRIADIARATIAACALVMTFFPLRVLLPGLHMQAPLNEAAWLIGTRYRECIYSADEVDFVNRVRDTIPANALVINAAPDGSMWSYGVNGLNTYYRDIKVKGHTDDAVLIRESLSRYAQDSRVREAVARTGATYVLLLDKDVPYGDGWWLWQYEWDDQVLWAGITSVDDDTPGFSLVLSEGDMRLYRIG